MVSSQLNPYERYVTLQDSLTGLVMSGARDIEWVNSQLQIIIGKPRPQFEVRGVDQKRAEELLAFWHERFPRRGRAILELLGPFYTSELSFALKPPVSDLGSMAEHAVFWRTISGVQVAGVGSWPEAEEACEKMRSIRVDLGTSLRDSLGESVLFHSETILKDELGRVLRQRIVDGFRETRGITFPSDLRIHRRQSGIEPGEYETRRAWTWARLVDRLWESLAASLCYAVSCMITRETMKDFRPLLDLWRSGNLPVGFDDKNRLIVLCANRN